MGVSSMKPLSHVGGLDIVRVGALVLVTIQHALSLTGHSNWLTFKSLNTGQTGVALFIAISALLAGTSLRPPLPWLIQRLRRLFPTYWIVMGVCFAIAWVSHYKQVTLAQFLSQMLGLGLFTHPKNLVNVPTWFVSLLLACYLMVFLIRLLPRPLLAYLALIAGLVLWEVKSGYVGSWMHLATFFAASALTAACSEAQRPRCFLAAGIGFLLALPFANAFAYTGIALASTGAALYVQRSPALINRLAKYSYDYYLIHGVFLAGAMAILPNRPVIAILLGIVLSAATAVVLHRFVARLMSRKARRHPGRTPANPC